MKAVITSSAIVAGPEFVEQLGRDLAEAEALLDMPFGDAEAGGDRLDRLAGVDQRRHCGELVRRVHRGADRVFHQRGFECRSGSSTRHGTL